MPSMSDSRLANLAAREVEGAFSRFQDQFRAVTRRARTRFEERDWHGMVGDATLRLDLYAEAVGGLLDELGDLMEERLDDRGLWAQLKAVYSGLIADRDDWELAETFFNSVTRRVFTTVGVDPGVEFVASDFDHPPTGKAREVFQHYDGSEPTATFVEEILTDFRFETLYEDIQRDADLAARIIDTQLAAAGLVDRPSHVEMVKQVFFRGKSAYLVGRMVFLEQAVPLVLALRNDETGVVVDAVLVDEDDASILFSFTRSYFHVQVDRPYDLVQFLRSVMPLKPIAELYRAIGYHKHGKTQQYRDLLDYLEASRDRFLAAPGVPGLVMVVFTMAGYDFVFKVMRDVFGAPKRITRRRVRDRYRLVFRHDRAGRLIDAQQFEHLRFERDRFEPALLEELLTACSRLVRLENGKVVIDHAYIERRVAPLDLYVRYADPPAAAAAVVDYGAAIRDLAATNIFPGDMLLKNFGVTRHGRVVFYDYDELALLLDCRFRRLPEAIHADDEMSEQPWFGVAENDMFPEEFRNYLGLPPELRAVFEQHHEELFDPAYWQAIQRRLEGGELIDVRPYSSQRQLRAVAAPTPG